MRCHKCNLGDISIKGNKLICNNCNTEWINKPVNKKTLFDEVLSELNKADIIYYQRCNSDGSFDSDDKNIKAIEIFCKVIEKKIDEVIRK